MQYEKDDNKHTERLVELMQAHNRAQDEARAAREQGPPSGHPANDQETDEKLADLENEEARLAEGQRARYIRPAPPGSGIPFVWLSSLSEEAAQVPELVEGVLTAGAMGVIYGESNSGKSYITLDLACAVARGVPWLGRGTVQGMVTYVAAEGGSSIARRLIAYRKHHRDYDFPIALVNVSLDFRSSAKDTELLAATVNKEAKAAGDKPTLIVIDTLSRAMAGGNENSSEDMGALVRHGDLLRELTGAHVLWVHHCGKDAARGARGHSLLRAATDTEIEVTQDKPTGIRNVRITKQRDLDSVGEELHARLKPMEMGINQWGKPITACVLEEAQKADKSNAPDRVKPLRPLLQRALDSLGDLTPSARLSGEGTSVIPPGKALLLLDDWREAFRKRCGEVAESTFRGYWSLVQKELLVLGRVGFWEKWVWQW